MDENGGLLKREWGMTSNGYTLPGGVFAQTNMIQIDIDSSDSFLFVCA